MVIKVNFNNEHWKKVHHTKRPFNDFTKMFDEYKSYCFPIKKYLGENGKVEPHYLIGKKLINLQDYKTYNIQEVCVHFYNGGYYYVLLIEENRSHGMVFWENINCEDRFILNAISDDRKIFFLS